MAPPQRVEVLDGDWTLHRAESVEAAHAAGARVWPDIQRAGEDGAHWQGVLALGFTGVQTDSPGALARWLTETGRR